MDSVHELLEGADTSATEDTASLRRRYQNALDEVLKTSELITQKLVLLEVQEANWKALAAQAADKIKLDVGGKIFCIAKSHLLSVEGSYFHAMLSSGHWKPDSDGAYFIDRNPKHFDRVLDYLRTGELSYAGMRSDQIDALKKTLDYLLLGPPDAAHPPAHWDPNMCGTGVTLSQDNRVLISNGDRRSARSVDRCVRYSIRLDADAGTAHVMIGFAPPAGFIVNADSFTTCGWYLYAHNGTLYSQDGVRGKSYGAGRIALASVVTCILDRETDSISFEVNGQSHGEAFTNVPKVEVYAALGLLGWANIQLTLVD